MQVWHGNPIVDRDDCDTIHSRSGFRANWAQEWQVLADGLTQLAMDTTLVSPLRSDVTAVRQAAAHDGAALEAARRRTKRVYLQLWWRAGASGGPCSRGGRNGGQTRQPGSCSLVKARQF